MDKVRMTIYSKKQLTDSLHGVLDCRIWPRLLYQQANFQYRSNILNSTCLVIARKVIARNTNSNNPKFLTQRLVLRLVSKGYDPIGLVALFTACARLILQDIWPVNGQTWDDELPKETVDRFIAWCVGLPQLAKITIPRSYFSGYALYVR